eukprot:6210360-Pleurochrysis_carterae.AAC.1
MFHQFAILRGVLSGDVPAAIRRSQESCSLYYDSGRALRLRWKHEVEMSTPYRTPSSPVNNGWLGSMLVDQPACKDIEPKSNQSEFKSPVGPDETLNSSLSYHALVRAS